MTYSQPPQLTAAFIERYMVLEKAIEARAIRLVESLLFHDQLGLVFTRLSATDGLDRIEIREFRWQTDWLDGKQSRRLMCSVTIDASGVGSDSATFDADLLFWKDEQDMVRRIKAYLERIEAPVRRRSRQRELAYLRQLTEKYPEDAREILQETQKEAGK